MTRRAMLDRNRINAVLDGRFDRRLTVMHAGAGFGKTTALRQMIDRNADGSLGTDWWLALRPLHARPGELAAALASVIPGVSPSSDVVGSVADAVWHRSPHEVAVVLDDVHVLGRDGEAATIVADLLERLPDNGHLVLVGRAEPPVRARRLEALGDAVVIGERDLAFTGPEQTEFLTLRQVDGVGGDLGGWPALLELAAAAGGGTASAFVWEEVIEHLDPRRVRDLARVRSLDHVDAARLEALTGESGIDAFVDGLPLVHMTDGVAHFHSLWDRLLEAVDPEWTAGELDAAWRALAAQRDHHAALSLVLDHGDRDAAEKLTLAYAGWAAEHQPTVRLETFLDMLPAESRQTPGGRLLQGLLHRRSNPREAKPHLTAAREAFAAVGNAELEAMTLGLLATVAFSEWNADDLAAVVAAARRIGTPAGDAAAAMAEATRATVAGESFAVVASQLDEARAAGTALQGADGVTAGVSARIAGVPEAALPYIERAGHEATRANKPLVAANRFDVSFLAGTLPVEILSAFDAGPDAGLAEMSHQASAVSGLMAFANAVHGRRREARRHAERADAFRHAVVRPGLGAPLIARMAIEILEGDEVAAGLTADEITAEMVHTDVAVARALPMAIVVSERVRALFEAVESGPCYRPARAGADALIALREREDAAPAAALSWDDPAKLRVFLVPPLVLELAIAAASEGVRPARSIAAELAADDRAALRRLTDRGPREARKLAVELLKTVPARPATSLWIRTLGPLELRVDGEVVDDPLLRRDRVRAMLHYLLVHGSCRREELGVALWPDFDPESMGNNLRVNLSHLGKLLEPERRKGEPAYFLRIDGDRIALHRDVGLVLDVDEFDELCDAADKADRSANPARTLEFLERAVGLAAGDYLEDAADPAWGDAERTRVRHRLVRSVLRAGQLRLAHGEFDLALAHAVRARSADEFNEEALRLEATVYDRRGDRSSARRVLDQGVAGLRAEGFEPAPETQRLLDRLR